MGLFTLLISTPTMPWCRNYGTRYYQEAFLIFVQQECFQGHEIAVHSITHRGPEEWWGKNATIEDWFDEMVGQANIINRFGGVDMEDIRGLRVPFLSVGWNRQFLMMREFGFVYDSSIPAPVSDPPLWPYTLDYKIPHKCIGEILVVSSIIFNKKHKNHQVIVKKYNNI